MKSSRPRMELLPFQNQAVEDVLAALSTYAYGDVKNGVIPTDIGGIYTPCIRIVRAITGAGKTPILAKVVASLTDSVVLWTTPMNAVIQQTAQNLSSNYQHILGTATEIYSIPTMTQSDWNQVLEAETGTSVLVSTVGTFNVDGKIGRRIHDEGRWQNLREPHLGGTRKRQKLFVVYDEAHNLTAQQAGLLLELSPRAMVLASGSPIGGDGLSRMMFMGPRTWEEIAPSLTTLVPTEEVVQAGLLKQRIELTACDLDRSNIVQQAVDKRDGLADLLKGKEDAEEPICCHIVSGGSGQGGGTKAALEIWDILTAAGVAAKDIAVHVTNGKKAADADSVSRPGFTDTYLLNLSPSEIRESGFKHIIWNKALREGWDEPWAFVAYIEGRNQSSVDIQQKIGRLLRNPFRNILGQPTVAKDDELGSCYFFLEEDNIRFAELLKAVQLDMQAEYSPLIEVTKKSLVYRELLPKEHLSLTKYKVVPDQMALREKLEKCIRCPKEEDRFASGEVAKGSIDLASGETTQSNVTQSASMVQISISHLVSELLRERDPRLVRGWLDDDVWDNETMSMKLAYRSTAYGQVTSDVTSFLEAVPNLLSMTESKLRWELGSSKIVDGADKRSRSIAPTTAYHEEYDGLNDLEYEVALTLDDANCKWFRNPVQKGYCVEMRRAVRGSSLFFPDFVAVKNDKIFLVEPKGEHLLIEAKLSKLFDLPNNKIQIYLLSANGSDRAIHTVSGTQNFGSTKEAIAWMFGHST